MLAGCNCWPRQLWARAGNSRLIRRAPTVQPARQNGATAQGGLAIELAAVLLGSVVLLRIALAAVGVGLVRAVLGSARGARRALLALRPSLAHRLVAAALGLAAPASALASAAGPAAASTLEPGTPSLHPAATAGSDQPPTRYVVRRGDTLWDIARRHLPADAGPSRVARAWPRWYAANRGVIGADPSLIVPGQRLLVPGRRSAGTPTQPHAAPAPTTGTQVPSALSLDPDRR